MKISEIIHGWYKKNRRDLPWRQTSDPYYIWISEVILQQTRVNQGLAYYLRFVQAFPEVGLLAKADERRVLKLWQGLGYYSRATNMLLAALQVMEQYSGVFPGTYKDLIKLRGVGPYTAAAIASISSGEKVAAVDGNIARVLSRLFLIEDPVSGTKGRKVIQELADDLLFGRDPGMHNQAMMEFGALQCVPRNPDCSVCPLLQHCLAYKHKKVADLPAKAVKRVPARRFFLYLIIYKDEHIYLSKRSKQDIWKELYEFPLIESGSEIRESEYASLILDYLSMEENELRIVGISSEYKHQLSHQTIFARFIQLHALTERDFAIQDWRRVRMDEISQYPVPRLVGRYLEDHQETTDW